MGTKKLETQLETVEIKQTRDQIDPIRFRDEAINKIKKDNYNFGKKRFKYIPFKVSKDSHQIRTITHHNRLFQLILLAFQLSWFIFKLFSQFKLLLPLCFYLFVLIFTQPSLKLTILHVFSTLQLLRNTFQFCKLCCFVFCQFATWISFI